MNYLTFREVKSREQKVRGAPVAVFIQLGEPVSAKKTSPACPTLNDPFALSGIIKGIIRADGL